MNELNLICIILAYSRFKLINNYIINRLHFKKNIGRFK